MLGDGYVVAMNDIGLREAMIKQIEHDHYFDYAYRRGDFGHYSKAQPDCTADYRQALEAMNVEDFLATFNRVKSALESVEE